MKHPLNYFPPDEHRTVRVVEVSERALNIYLGPERTCGGGGTGCMKGKWALATTAITHIMATPLICTGMIRVGGTALSPVAWICGAMWATAAGVGLAVHLCRGAVWGGQMVLRVFANRVEVGRLVGANNMFVLGAGELRNVEVLPGRRKGEGCVRLAIGPYRPIEICHGCSPDDIASIARMLARHMRANQRGREWDGSL
jgi:hypothetical protein